MVCGGGGENCGCVFSYVHIGSGGGGKGRRLVWIDKKGVVVVGGGVGGGRACGCCAWCAEEG